jgi:hypothetical protein
VEEEFCIPPIAKNAMMGHGPLLYEIDIFSYVDIRETCFAGLRQMQQVSHRFAVIASQLVSGIVGEPTSTRAHPFDFAQGRLRRKNKGAPRIDGIRSKASAIR